MADDTKILISKALNGLVALVAAVGIAVGGFALKNNYEAALNIKELSVRVATTESNTADNEKLGEHNSAQIHLIQVSIEGRISDLKAIKEDIAEIKQMLKERK